MTRDSARFERNLRRAQWKDGLRENLPAVALALLAVCLVVGVIGYPPRNARDLLFSVARTERGVVTAIVFNAGSKGRIPTRTVALQIGRKWAHAATELPLGKGQAVSVTYRVGASGRVYVDRIAPLAPGL